MNALRFLPFMLIVSSICYGKSDLLDVINSDKVFEAHKIWSITFVNDQDSDYRLVRLAYDPEIKDGNVCETKVNTFDKNRSDGEWMPRSSYQALAVINEKVDCDYRDNIENFHRITGDYLEPSLFEKFYEELIKESNKLKEIILNNDPIENSIIEADFSRKESRLIFYILASGCELEVSYKATKAGRIQLKEYSHDDVKCRH